MGKEEKAITEDLMFELSDEEELFRHELRERLKNDKRFQSIVQRALYVTDFDHELFLEAFNFFKDAGYCAYGIPEEYGGWLGSSRGSVILTEEICKYDGGIGLSLGATSSLVGSPIALFGTEAQKKLWLTKIAAGEVIGCYCQSEPEAGSDVAGITTKAEFKNGRWVINGQKHFITNGSEAHLALVIARVGEDRYGGLAVFIVDLVRAKAAGQVTILRNEKKAGLHLSPTTAMSFDDCIADDVLGAVWLDSERGWLGDGWKILNSTLVGSRATAICAQGKGITQGSFNAATNFASSRTQFGMLLTDMPKQRTRILRMEAALKIGELLSWRASVLRDALGKADSRPWQKEASMAKLWCGEMAVWGTSEMMQLCGGVGYTNPKIYKFWLDGRIVPIYEGTSDVQCLIIIRETLRQEAKGIMPYAIRASAQFWPKPARVIPRVLAPVSGIIRSVAALSVRNPLERQIKRLLGKALEEYPIDPNSYTLPAVYFPIAEAIAAVSGANLVRGELMWRRTTKREVCVRDQAVSEMSTMLAKEKIDAAERFFREVTCGKAIRQEFERKAPEGHA